ncbi:hypothetical protein N0V94_001570 [Neodidymelliopsis sp. IMI 364377]|nr:hypothetical protein N0V94_001570 [Neodidymelliopsis sp. IMI 364377]
MADIEAVPASAVKSTVACYSRADFVRGWTFPLQPLHDFKLDGEPAQYAPGHPKEWGDEMISIDFREAIRDGQPEKSYVSYRAAISPDKALLAITSTYERILVYDIESQEVRQVLDGAGDLVFAPLQSHNEKTIEGECTTNPAYILGCSVSDENSRSGVDNQLVFWELDQYGRLLDQEEPIDATAFAAQAIDAILPDLMTKHEWSREFVAASSLHADLAKALSVAATTYRRRHNALFKDARFGSFGSTPFSNDGKLFVYHFQNTSTQSGMRDPEDLPQVIVVDMIAGKELHRLSGHTDAIMWSAISPDAQHVASVSWDGTLRMCSLTTGELEWVTDAGGQSWTGAFSADSKHIVWSSGNGQAVFVHKVEGGQGLSVFPETFRTWCRSLAWHPDGKQIALCCGKHVYVWRPFDGTNGKITQHYQIDDEKNWKSMASIEQVAWLDHGRLLHLYVSDGTNLIYDTRCNLKELLLHPNGVDSAWVSSGFYGDLKITSTKNGYVSVDGDGKVRYWSSGVVVRNSWWEKTPKKIEHTANANRTPFPETGKYVKVTRRPTEDKETVLDDTI